MSLQIRNLSFERNYQPLLATLNLHVQPGEGLQIRGANGAGKSTLLRLIAGFLEPTSGLLSWHDKPIHQHLSWYQPQLHYLSHANGLKAYLTVTENLKLMAALQQQTLTDNRSQEIMQLLGLHKNADRLASELSAGLARRLALARLVLNPQPLWLLDEPATTLDAQGQAVLHQLLNAHLAQKGIAIIATHHDLSLDHAINTLWLDQHDA